MGERIRPEPRFSQHKVERFEGERTRSVHRAPEHRADVSKFDHAPRLDGSRSGPKVPEHLKTVEAFHSKIQHDIAFNQEHVESAQKKIADLNKQQKSAGIVSRFFGFLGMGPNAKRAGLIEYATEIRDIASSKVKLASEVANEPGMIQTVEDAHFVDHLIHALSLEKQPASIKDPLTRARKGKELLSKVLEGNAETKSLSDEDYLDNIRNIVWGQYALAAEKGQGFESGNMLVNDPEQKLYQYYLGYAGQVNPGFEKTSTYGTFATKAYSRWSSHYPEERLGGKNYGIDLRGPDGSLVEGLPTNKRHLLLGYLPGRDGESGYTFNKPEDWGTSLDGSGSWFRHNLDFLNKRKVRLGGGYDRAMKRSEKVISSMKEDFNSFMGSETLGRDEKAEIKKYGLSAMYRVLENKKGKQAAESFLGKLKGRGFSVDHISRRKGKEIIFGADDMGALRQRQAKKTA